uniref:Uncharacterized protein n=1 Tax=Ditylum brightwellii TaxID=49249 RepID=A0A7S1YUJ8_9STRA|mmetsp:Transcript_17764/g.26505  ORF Transcript_17764/g.26505 Transcript_17764/m.26505 type:complete len:964 (+) Transcript_17764:157-3048(+)
MARTKKSRQRKQDEEERGKSWSDVGSSDEEIDEDEAFNSDDEKKYGAIFESLSSSKKKKKKSHDSDDDKDDDKDDEDVTSSSESDDDDDDDSDSDSDDDGIASGSDDSDEEGDGGDYMLQLLNRIDSNAVKQDKHEKNQSIKTYTSSLPPESVHAASSVSKSATAGGGPLTLDGLMGEISDTKGFQSVQKAMRSMVAPDADYESSGKKKLETTKAPTSRVISERAKRKVHYQESTKDVGRWDESIKQNRFAETLDFRNKNRIDKASKEELVGKFVPTTDFEKEIAMALEKAGGDEETMAEKEREALLGIDGDDLGENKITMEEYKRRVGELAKTRALLFYEEQKRHHMNKIKSKKYRKIRKRQRERRKDEELAHAIEEDPDLARELEEKEEMERMKERMSLAHKNTSKWAKRVLRRGSKMDTETRRALSAQLKRGDDLRRKMDSIQNGEDASDDSEEEDELKLIEHARDVLKQTEEDGAAADDGDKKKKGLFQLSFMQKGIAAQRERAKEEARQLLRELEANVPKDSDCEDDMEEEVAPKKKQHKGYSAQKKELTEEETAKVIAKGSLVASSLDFGNADTLAVSGNIDVDLGDDDDDQDEEMEKEEGEASDNEKEETIAATDTPSKQKKRRQKRKKGNMEEGDANADASGDHTTTITLSNSKKANTAEKENEEGTGWNDDNKDNNEEEDGGKVENPWIQSDNNNNGPSSKKKRRGKKGVSKAGIVDVKGAVDSLLAHNKEESKNTATSTNKEEEKKEEEETKAATAGGGGKRKRKKKKGGNNNSGNIANLSQDELVRRAFAAPSTEEVEEEFAKEKNEIRERDDPTLQKKDEDANTVSGWGSWVGVGAPPPKKKSRKNLPAHLQPPEKKKEEKGRRRQDDNKKNVIINERRIKKNAKFQLHHIPHPYTSREQYEIAMAGGVGPEWNVSHAVKELTRPEIYTRAGKIIQPLSKNAKAKRAPAKF